MARETHDDEMLDREGSTHAKGTGSTTGPFLGSAGTPAGGFGTHGDDRERMHRDEGSMRDRDRSRDHDTDQTIQLREEELTAQKRMREAGEVSIRKDVVEEQRTMDVPVMREELVIDRRSVDRRPADGPIGASGEVIEVPLREEEVTAEKRAFVREEIEVGKRVVQDTERVSGTVRKEVLDVGTEGGAHMIGEEKTGGGRDR